MSLRWLSWGLMAVAMLLPRGAWADDPSRYRLSEVLDATDRRIELATSLVAESTNAPAQAQSELVLARDLQARARTAFSANDAVVAYRASMDARAHADRSIAIIRGLPDPDRVTSQVERTRDILDRARDRLQACDNLRARAMLRVAIDMQERAESRLNESMYLGALQLTMSARERVQKAMHLCNVNESMGDAADRAIQRTNEILARATDVLDADSPPAQRELLVRAQAIQVQAQGESRLQHYESALRLTQDARALALRVLRSARTGRGHGR